MTEKALLSADGYFIRQEGAEAYPYGAHSSDDNGCGWIAVYNLLHALGRDITPEDVNREMAEKLTFHGHLGTTMRVMTEALTAHGLQFSLGRGRREALRLGSASDLGILRYWEGLTAHFVCYLRQGDGSCRFLNVNEDLEELIVPLAVFLKERPSLPFIRILAVSP